VSGPSEADGKVGFDGKIRQKPPSIGRWMVVSFAISVVYWLASLALLPADVSSATTIPFLVGSRLAALGLIIGLVPFLTSLTIAFAFRLAEREAYSWVMLTVAALLTAGFGRLAAFIFGGLLSSHG